MAEKVLRSARPLRDLSRIIGRGCFLPWVTFIPDGYGELPAYEQQEGRLGLIDEACSYEELAAYMYSRDLG